MKHSTSGILGGLLLLSTGAAQAVVIIDNATQGLYNDGLGDLAAIDGPGGFFLGANVSEGDPTVSLAADPALSFPAAFGADWLNGDYSGGNWSAGPVAIPGNWAVNTETAIVYDFTLGELSDLTIDVGVDNGIIIWLNGDFVFGAQASGGANINEYDINLTGLAAGDHSLQILREDHGGATGYLISVDQRISPVAPAGVPEPAITALLGGALLALGWRRRRSGT